jgi:hypothetical protein
MAWTPAAGQAEKTPEPSKKALASLARAFLLYYHIF